MLHIRTLPPNGSVLLKPGWRCSHTGTIRRTSTGTTPTTGWSYVPTPGFANQRAGVSVGAAPRLHGVLAHLRTLAAGQTPSPDAQSRAPSRLRARMKKNQTFVRPHFRGQAYRGILDARLSKYSTGRCAGGARAASLR